MGTRRKRGPFGPGLGDRVQAVTISNLILWCALVLLGSSCLADLAACPRQCHCPKYQPCPPGVRLVLDDCRCCQVCARRFNEDCDALRPCDRARGLRCQLEATPNATHGICRASTPGRPCVMDGKVYQHGEVFKQTCRLQCTCKDGKAACYPLCPSRLAVLPASCADARLVKLPGTCCKKWKCASSYSKDKALRMRKWKEALVSASQVARQRKAVRKMRGQFKHQSSSDSGCRVKNTEWSMCSRTCDMGISVRQSNNNTWCQPKQEIRLCQLRRCDMLNDVHLMEGKTCLKSDKEKEPRPFVFAGCTSLRRYTPKYCGFCTDGRCCQPSETRTTKVRFRCWGVKETFVKDVMKIKRCKCNRRCQQDSGHHRPGDAASDGSTDRKSTQETHRNF